MAKCRRRFLSIAASVTTAVLLCSPARGLDVVKAGKPKATIVVAKDAGNYQKWAAHWLQEYVMKATGAVLPIRLETRAPFGTLISVGHTEMAKKAGIATDDLKYDGCKVVVKGRVLYLIGRDDVPLWDKYPTVKQSAAQGSIRAVTTFLEDVVGVRWFLPGPEGTIIPTTKDLAVPDSFTRTFIPAVAYSRAAPYSEVLANYANNFRVAIKYWGYGGHSWYVHVPAEKYFKDHPEYFHMDESGRRTAQRGHLCTSNREIWRIMVHRFREKFDEGYDIVQLGQSDGWQPCLCPACIKTYGDHRLAPVSEQNPAERIWTMHKWIMDECRKSHPDKKIMVIIYGPTGWPSKKFDQLPDNAIGEMAPITPERLVAWRGKLRWLTTYLYWWEDNCNASGFVPAVSPEWLQKTMREYRDLGVIGITGGPRINWGLGGPSFYAFGKLMGDPDLNMDALLHEYCMGVYGNSGRVMKRFFKLFHSRSGFTRELKKFPNSYPAEDTLTALYPPRIVAELDRLLSKAEKKADSERSREWVKHARDCFDGLRAVAEMFTAKRMFEMQPTQESLSVVKARVDAFEEWRARILSYDEVYARRWFPAYTAMAGHLMTGGDNRKYDAYYYSQKLVREHLAALRGGEKKVRGIGIGGDLGHNEIRVPITWDFKQIAAKLGRPKEEKVVEVKYTRKPIVLDGRIGPEWNGVPAHAFEPYKAAGSKVKDAALTTARLMYDDENLYVAYECAEPSIEKMKLKSVGRDGNVYGNDEVELFLNTDENSDRKVMQFMAAPIEDAFYDARKGFIEDALNPNYNRWEITSWNVAWRYAFHIDKANKKWTLEIAMPFKGLGVAPPAPGTVWTGNFARCRRVDGEDLSSWIPAGFGNPELFGEIVFGTRE